MTTAAREIASLVTGLIGIVLVGIGLNRVLDIGSCVSGGSYVVARECPERMVREAVSDVGLVVR